MWLVHTGSADGQMVETSGVLSNIENLVNEDMRMARLQGRLEWDGKSQGDVGGGCEDTPLQVSPTRLHWRDHWNLQFTEYYGKLPLNWCIVEVSACNHRVQHYCRDCCHAVRGSVVLLHARSLSLSRTKYNGDMSVDSHLTRMRLKHSFFCFRTAVLPVAELVFHSSRVTTISILEHVSNTTPG